VGSSSANDWSYTSNRISTLITSPANDRFRGLNGRLTNSSNPWLDRAENRDK